MSDLSKSKVTADIKQTTQTSWKENLTPGSFGEEAKNFKKYLSLDTWHYLVIIGIAVSGLAAFVSTYDAISGINNAVKICTESNVLKKEIDIKFIVLLVLSCFAVILGLVLAWFFRGQDNQRKLLTLAIMTTGIFGILYALTIKFHNASNTFKLFASWLTFLGFLVLGWFLSTKKNVKVVTPIDWDV